MVGIELCGIALQILFRCRLMRCVLFFTFFGRSYFKGALLLKNPIISFMNLVIVKNQLFVLSCASYVLPKICKICKSFQTIQGN